MQIIKRYIHNKRDNAYRCAVWTDTYAHSLSHVNMLTRYAFEHDSDLTDDDIYIMKYAGDRYKGMTAIEFNTKVRPDYTWREWHQLEYIA